MKFSLKTEGKSLARDESGQFSVWISILAFPIVMATSLAIDMKLAEGQQQSIQRAVDVAAIAVATNNSISDKKKVNLAKRVFRSNYTGDLNVNLDVELMKDRVHLDASAAMKTTLGGVLGKKTIDIERNGTAMMDTRNTICVLALAPKGRNRVSFIGKTDFDAPTCAVQANSTHPRAMRSTTSATPVAKSFCSTGGALGRYDPYVKGECRVIEDPYKDTVAPQPGPCLPQSTFQATVNQVPGNGGRLQRAAMIADIRRLRRLNATYSSRYVNVPVSDNIAKPNAVLSPGTYCGGLTVKSKNITFNPGVYIIKDGPLTFQAGATAMADDVTFVMHGKDSTVTIEEGAELWLKAPKKGPTAGMAFFQDIKSNTGSKNLPNGLNLIASGGKLDVVGTLYFPTQSLDISGTSSIGAQSPATSFIAYEVTFAGKAKATIGIDHVAAGLPPLLPQADDGARLLK